MLTFLWYIVVLKPLLVYLNVESNPKGGEGVFMANEEIMTLAKKDRYGSFAGS